MCDERQSSVKKMDILNGPFLDFIIFDTDGTLVDNLELIVLSYNHAVSSFFDREFTVAEVSSLFGPTMELILSKTVPSEHVNAAVGRYHEYYRTHFRKYARPYPRIHHLLRELQRAGKALAVFTGSGREMAYVTLDQSGLSRFFPTIITGDDLSRPKPDPEGLYLAMRAMGASAQRTIFVGDSPADIEASRKAGIMSAAAVWSSKEHREVKMLRPDFIFRDPVEALDVLLHDCESKPK